MLLVYVLYNDARVKLLHGPNYPFEMNNISASVTAVTCFENHLRAIGSCFDLFYIS